jgi:malonyl-CoA O-methyltransferase
MNWFRRRSKPVEMEVLDAYAQWAAAYSPEAHNPLMALEEQAMLALLPPLAGQRALDLACGSGRYLRRFSDAQPARTLGLDLSPAMLARAAALGQPLAQADLLHLPLATESWDVAVCGLAVGHVAALASVLGEIGRVLAPGGSVVYSDLHPFGALAGWKRSFRGRDGREYSARHHIHLYADHFAACESAGLSITAVREPRIDFEHPYRGYPAVLIIRAGKP